MNTDLVMRLSEFFSTLQDKDSANFIDEIPEEVVAAIDMFSETYSVNFFKAKCATGVQLDDIRGLIGGYIYLGWKLKGEIQKFDLEKTILGNNEQ